MEGRKEEGKEVRTDRQKERGKKGRKERQKDRWKKQRKEGRKEGYFGIFTEVTKYNYLPDKGLRQTMTLTAVFPHYKTSL